MTINAEVQKHEQIDTNDGEKLHRLELIDKCNPGSQRTGGVFEFYLNALQRQELPEGDLTDKRFNLVISEFRVNKAGKVGLRGKIVLKK